MATNLPCRDCTRNKFSLLTTKWTGPAILLLRNADSGLYTLEGEFKLGQGVNVVPGSVNIDVYNASGDPPTWPTVTYSADDVSTPGVLETTGTTTVVGTITQTEGTLKFTITFPAVPGGGFTALDDNSRIFIFWTQNNSKGGAAESPIFIGRTVEDDPCNLAQHERACFLTGASAIICPANFCDGDTPAIYVDGESVGVFDSTGKLIPDNIDVNVFGYIESAINKVVVGFGNPGLPCDSQVIYKNGNEEVVLNPVTILQTFSYDLTGTDVTAGITLNSLITNGVDRFLTRAAIVATTGTLDAQGADLATKLTAELGLGTWTYTAATDVLSVRTPFVLGDLAGLDGAGAALTVTPAVS